MSEVLGFFGMVVFTAAAIPQMLKAKADGHAKGLAWGYVILLMVGMLSMLGYMLLTAPQAYPVIINYILQLIMFSVIIYYKVRGG